MCNAPAVDKEHAPPKSFFPPGYRRNLLTVPSCPLHNSNNSKDVEYVRNIIAGQRGTNDVAANLSEKAMRSFDRSPKLLNQTFATLRTVHIDGDETGAFRFDLKRHENIMKAIAYALYFHDHGRKHFGDWRIFTPSLAHAEALYGGRPDPWEPFRQYLASGQFTNVVTPEPQVFKYGIIQLEENQLLYRFEFYEGFVVNAWTLFETFVQFEPIRRPGLLVIPR
jgi:hypothetical protein